MGRIQLAPPTQHRGFSRLDTAVYNESTFAQLSRMNESL